MTPNKLQEITKNPKIIPPAILMFIKNNSYSFSCRHLEGTKYT